MADAQLYKILDRRGVSPHMRFKYSLPTDAGAGDWHRVEGEVRPHGNGFHLTSNPVAYLAIAGRNVNRSRVFVAEASDPQRVGYGDSPEFVAGAVRLVKEIPLSALRDSSAYTLLAAAYRGCGDTTGQHSWRRLNDAMQAALRLAIAGHFHFDPEDFRRIHNAFKGEYWMGDGEQYYGLSITGPHGPNRPAIASYEAWRNRKPFIVEADSRKYDSSPLRLHVGATFDWFLDHDLREFSYRRLKVTSFDDSDGRVVACSYWLDRAANKIDPSARGARGQVERVLKLTHRDILAQRAAVRARRDTLEGKTK